MVLVDEDRNTYTGYYCFVVTKYTLRFLINVIITEILLYYYRELHCTILNEPLISFRIHKKNNDR